MLFVAVADAMRLRVTHLGRFVEKMRHHHLWVMSPGWNSHALTELDARRRIFFPVSG
jgi:hypothetical protein